MLLMQSSRVSADRVKIHLNENRTVYIAIGGEAEMLIYPSTQQSIQAQVKELKHLARRMWDELNFVDEDSENWVSDAGLAQPAIEEEVEA
jgi:hypothetical protein